MKIRKTVGVSILLILLMAVFACENETFAEEIVWIEEPEESAIAEVEDEIVIDQPLAAESVLEESGSIEIKNPEAVYQEPETIETGATETEASAFGDAEAGTPEMDSAASLIPSEEEFILEMEQVDPAGNSELTDTVYEPGTVDSVWDTASQGTVVEEIKVELYALDITGYISIPASCPTEYQINLPEAGTPVYRVVSGESAVISASGLITPRITIYYWNGNVGSTESSGAEGERVTQEHTYGSTVIEATLGEKIWRYTVEVIDYARLYADQVMDEYLSENITDSMSTMEKLEKIAQFPCQYNYSADYASAVGMIISGGGDCWASTDAILKLCKKIGIPASSRDARGDLGAGDGHLNVIAKVDGKLYIVDAGYTGNAPRYYSIEEENLYRYSVSPDGKTAVITAYNGIDNVVYIPENIDGYTVTEIAENAFYYKNMIRSVIIPSSVKKIGSKAFYATSIQAVKIPEGVTAIDKDAFMEIIDYNGPNGAFGTLRPLELIELPSTLEAMDIDLSESFVLYHGTQEQWNRITISDPKYAPEEKNLFCSADVLEIRSSDTDITLQCGETQKIPICTFNDDVSVENSNTGVVEATLSNEPMEYYHFRDENYTDAVHYIKTLSLNMLDAGNAVISVSSGSIVKQISVSTVHQYVTKVQEPTCTESGSSADICSECGQIREGSQEVIPALGHIGGKATCISLARCTRCRELYGKYGEHTYSKYKVRWKATYDFPGLKVHTCSKCGSMEMKPIPKLVGTMKLNVSSIKLKTGQSTSKVKVSGLKKDDAVETWKSSNSKIVKVSNKGRITAQSRTGTAKITVTLKSGLSKSISVTVQKDAVACTKISLNKKSLTLKKGKSFVLKPTVSPVTCVQKVKYVSSNKKIAAVSKSGKITAKKKGKATITVTVGKKKAKCKITVK